MSIHTTSLSLASLECLYLFRSSNISLRFSGTLAPEPAPELAAELVAAELVAAELAAAELAEELAVVLARSMRLEPDPLLPLPELVDAVTEQLAVFSRSTKNGWLTDPWLI